MVKSENKVQGSAISFHPVSLGNQTQINRLAEKPLCPLSRLGGPHRVLNSKVAGTGDPERRAECRTTAPRDVEQVGEGKGESCVNSKQTCAVPERCVNPSADMRSARAQEPGTVPR